MIQKFSFVTGDDRIWDLLAKEQLNYIAGLTAEQKQTIKEIVYRESWLRNVIDRYMPKAPLIMRFEFVFPYLGIYVLNGKETISSEAFDQSNECVRTTVEFLEDNIDWLKPMIAYYSSLHKNSSLESDFRALMKRADYETADSRHEEFADFFTIDRIDFG